MEVPQIEEIRLDTQIDHADERVEVKAAEAEKRKCVYNKEMACQAPDCKMAICEKCPYGKSYSFSSNVKDVFNKIVGMAIFLAKSDDVLRDVMVLIAKGDVEDKGKEGVGGAEVRGGLEVKEGEEAQEAGNGEEGAGEKGLGTENAADTMPSITPANIKDVKVETLSARQIMMKLLSNKVADINEALANPNGREKPLV